MEADSASIESNLTVQIDCRTCYMTGTVSGSYTHGANINVTALEEDVKQTVDIFTEDVKQALEDFIFHHANSTTVDFNDVDLPSSKEFDYELQILLEDLELYMKLDTALSAESTYTIPLYKSESPVGVSLTASNGTGFELGAFFTVELILSSKGEIDVSSGVHIKVDRATLNIGMFDNNVSRVTL